TVLETEGLGEDQREFVLVVEDREVYGQLVAQHPATCGCAAPVVNSSAAEGAFVCITHEPQHSAGDRDAPCLKNCNGAAIGVRQARGDGSGIDESCGLGAGVEQEEHLRGAVEVSGLGGVLAVR